MVSTGLGLARATGLVKICGLREPVHARAAAAAGANLLGFVFAPARRRITAETARACIAAARDAAPERRIAAVGVFVDASAAEMNATAQTAGLDLLQLHGDEAPALLARLHRPVVKAIRPPHGTPVHDALDLIRPYQGVANAPVAYLLDGHSPGAAGGTGVRADWHLAAELAGHFPLVLAGGLDPTNVADAIAIAAPIAVDVSSGVETDGIKDATKIAAFVDAARQAFRFDPDRRETSGP